MPTVTVITVNLMGMQRDFITEYLQNIKGLWHVLNSASKQWGTLSITSSPFPFISINRTSFVQPLMIFGMKRKNDEKLKNMKKQLELIREEYDNEYEIEQFYKTYSRFIEESGSTINWKKVKQPEGKIVKYEDLEESADPKDLLSKLAVLKLNGGLGTTMGCHGSKSAIQVKKGQNFLDMSIKQVQDLNKQHGVKVPFILMNSFNTDKETIALTKQYKDIIMFNQPKHPRIDSKTHMIIEGDERYYPAGHGEMLIAIVKTGVLDELIEKGKEYVFVSNVDNLAATVDLKILEYLQKNNIDFGMEVTEKTKADVKGGTLINYDGKLKLLEIAQVPEEYKKEFKSIDKFKIFNTNSVWINLRALKIAIEKGMDLDIIRNEKRVEGKSVIQLETAVGAAVKFFERNCGILVPRSRFVPVKSCSDLFLLRSSLYEDKNGVISMTPKRNIPSLPSVRLIGSNFSDIKGYEECVQSEPDIVDMESLVLAGNVVIQKNVTLKGEVIICATDGSQYDVPENSVLENKIIINGEIVN